MPSVYASSQAPLPVLGALFLTGWQPAEMASPPPGMWKTGPISVSGTLHWDTTYLPPCCAGATFRQQGSMGPFKTRSPFPNIRCSIRRSAIAHFRNEIYLQRRLEPSFECDRWFDLVRTDRAVTEILANKKVTLPAFRLIYPIPQQEIDIMNNKATFPQNQGYD